jgi:hypothetical protein
MTPPKLPAAVALGHLGGSAKSEAKTIAVRANGRLGGRPRKDGTRRESPGTIVAAKARAAANGLSDAERAELYRRGMEIVRSGVSTQYLRDLALETRDRFDAEFLDSVGRALTLAAEEIERLRK